MSGLDAHAPHTSQRAQRRRNPVGRTSYQLLASFDLTREWTVLVWCDPYETPIAAADLT